MNNAADTMPFAKLMGVTVTEAAPERIVGELVVRDDLCTAGGILHGGAIMAFADSLGAIGGFMALPEGAIGTRTIESKPNFLGGAKAGVTVRGETDRHRRRQTRGASHANTNGALAALAIALKQIRHPGVQRR